MTEIGEIRVHTVFSAEQVERLGVRMRVLGFINILVAAAWLYVAWQPMYNWIQRTLAFGEINIATTAMNDGAEAGQKGDLNTLARIMNPNANQKNAGDEKKASNAESNEEDNAAAEASREEKAAAANVARVVLAGSALGWLGLSTLVGAWLLVAGVASLTNFAANARRFGSIVLPLSLIAIGVVVWYVWDQYHWYETLLPGWVKPTMLALLGIAAAGIGAIVNRHGLKLQRWGALLVVFSAIFSVVAIWAAVRWGQMPSEGVNVQLYAKVFGVQSAYGWLLLASMIGLK